MTRFSREIIYYKGHKYKSTNNKKLCDKCALRKNLYCTDHQFFTCHTKYKYTEFANYYIEK